MSLLEKNLSLQTGLRKRYTNMIQIQLDCSWNCHGLPQVIVRFLDTCPSAYLTMHSHIVSAVLGILEESFIKGYLMWPFLLAPYPVGKTLGLAQLSSSSPTRELDPILHIDVWLWMSEPAFCVYCLHPI
jgi:hypothetical protein